MLKSLRTSDLEPAPICIRAAARGAVSGLVTGDGSGLATAGGVRKPVEATAAASSIRRELFLAQDVSGWQLKIPYLGVLTRARATGTFNLRA